MSTSSQSGAPRAIIYAWTGGAAPSDSQGIESQLDECRHMAQNVGATIVEEFVDGRVPGNTLDRPGLQRLIWHVSTQSPDYVICQDLSQLSTDADDLLELLVTLAGYNTRVGLARGGSFVEMPSTDDESPEDDQ